MSTLRFRPRWAMAALVVVLVAAVQAGAETDEVVIRPTAIEPALLRTKIERRVTWVNRSNLPTHLEFTGNAGEHQVFQVPGRIWAVFHRPGRHTYVLHVDGPRPVTLPGAVDVADDPSVKVAACPAVTVMEACLEP